MTDFEMYTNMLNRAGITWEVTGHQGLLEVTVEQSAPGFGYIGFASLHYFRDGKLIGVGACEDP